MQTTSTIYSDSGTRLVKRKACDLIVQFPGEQRRVSPAETLTFGRGADLVLDSNPHMHRTVGRFWFDGESWLVDNVGSRIVLTLRDPRKVAATVLPPGQSGRLLSLDWSLSLRAGPAPYELHGHLDSQHRPVHTAVRLDHPPAENSTRTEPFASPALSAIERETLTALVHEHLRSAAYADVASNKDMAQMLGVTAKAVERRLDRLACRFAAAGVRGLKGTKHQVADRRRRVLATHVLTELIITPQDLALIEQPQTLTHR